MMDYFHKKNKITKDLFARTENRAALMLKLLIDNSEYTMVIPVINGISILLETELNSFTIYYAL